MHRSGTFQGVSPGVATQISATIAACPSGQGICVAS